MEKEFLRVTKEWKIWLALENTKNHENIWKVRKDWKKKKRYVSLSRQSDQALINASLSTNSSSVEVATKCETSPFLLVL